MIYILVSAVTTGEEKSNNTLREEQNLRDQKRKKFQHLKKQTKVGKKLTE